MFYLLCGADMLVCSLPALIPIKSTKTKMTHISPLSLKSKLIDYTLKFENNVEESLFGPYMKTNPSLLILSRGAETLGSVRIVKHRDGTRSYSTYHNQEGWTADLDSNHSLDDAKAQLVDFHIKYYES